VLFFLFPLSPMHSQAKSQEPHIKGHSRVLKVCHWCLKKQDPIQKPFQACGRCKEVPSSILYLLCSSNIPCLSLKVIYCVCFVILSVKQFTPSYMAKYGLTQSKECQAASWPLHKVHRFPLTLLSSSNELSAPTNIGTV